MTMTEGRGTARMLRDKANERRRVGWELSDVMTPRELDAIAAELDEKDSAAEKLMRTILSALDCLHHDDPEGARGVLERP